MPHYRIYLLNTKRRITSVREAEFPDDDAALMEAKSVIDGQAGAEVWSLARLVGYVPSSSSVDGEPSGA